jgi:hypothetical protein
MSGFTLRLRLIKMEAGMQSSVWSAGAPVRAAVVVVLLTLVPAFSAAATRYVAETGGDAGGCGVTAATACRSITQAIVLANPGDTILVGPGRYGDLNRNGILGDIPGEETGSPGCGCVLSINKSVIVISSAGAASTTIDGRSVDAIDTVLVITNGGEFGRPGKGFTVTETARINEFGSYSGSGIVLDAVDVAVSGNQVIFTRHGSQSGGHGIHTVNDAAIRIEGNLVGDWAVGVNARGAAVVARNQIMRNSVGIEAEGGSVVGNVLRSNTEGIILRAPAVVTGNALHTNSLGIDVRTGEGTIRKNNLLGNGCAIYNPLIAGLNATNNYWGSPHGPSSAGADEACGHAAFTTITSPFATKPFAVKVLKP